MGWRRWNSWSDWEAPRPRRQVNGIRAQTQRGKFGATWWAGRWLAALEQLVDEGRLSRGRSYARSGQVTTLEVRRGRVEAEVWGSAPEPYQVSIRFHPLGDAQWEQVYDAMSAKALYAARLLSGEMPEQIEEVFQAAGATLFPARAGDMETDCSCPDWSNPCKHLAAVFYLLGERFDADPFLMFELRGRAQQQVAAALRTRRSGVAAAGDADALPEAPAARPAGLPDGLRPPAPEQDDVPLETAAAGWAEAFWLAPDELAGVSIDFTPPEIDALALKQLGRPPFWPPQLPFPDDLEQLYRAIGQQARRLAAEDE